MKKSYTQSLLELHNVDFQKYKPQIHKIFAVLKKKKPQQLDALVHQWHDEIFDKIDCLECAKCCKNLGPRITIADVERISKKIKLKAVDFEKQYLRIDEDNDFVFKKMPCPFLMDDHYCNIYDIRPKACQEYPHTDRKRFYQLLDLTELNAQECPAAFEICKKIILHFDKPVGETRKF